MRKNTEDPIVLDRLNQFSARRTNFFLRDGNLRSWASTLCALLGIAITWFFLKREGDYYIRIIGMSIGLAIGAVGGYSAQAHTLGLHPFDISPWRRVRKTYEEKKNEE